MGDGLLICFVITVLWGGFPTACRWNGKTDGRCWASTGKYLKPWICQQAGASCPELSLLMNFHVVRERQHFHWPGSGTITLPIGYGPFRSVRVISAWLMGGWTAISCKRKTCLPSEPLGRCVRGRQLSTSLT